MKITKSPLGSVSPENEASPVTVDLSDGIFTLGCLFLGQACPPLPNEVCGRDPTEDKLDCGEFAACER